MRIRYIVLLSRIIHMFGKTCAKSILPAATNKSFTVYGILLQRKCGKFIRRPIYKFAHLPFPENIYVCGCVLYSIECSLQSMANNRCVRIIGCSKNILIQPEQKKTACTFIYRRCSRFF